MRLTTTDKIIFTKRLSFLLGAGIPVQKAMDIVSKQSRTKIQPILKDIAKNIHTGRSLSSCLTAHARSFPFYIIKLIKAGEESGQLKQSLVYISQEIERRKLLNQKIISALLYPCIILLGTIGLLLFLVFIIFPKIRTLFQSLHATLPLSTRIVIALSDMVHAYGIVILILFIFIAGSLTYWISHSESLQYRRDNLFIRIPLLSSLFKHYIVSSFLRTTGIMSQAHIPINTSLRYAADGVSNKIYREAILEISHSVTLGKHISHSMRTSPQLFSETIIQLIEAGEMSGKLSDTFLYLSDMLDQEIESMLKIIVTLIEPVLMAGIGLVVGFISLSIISPIYEITQNIKH
jgi:type II secretory pathway component PulF